MTLLREHVGSALRAEREGISLTLRDVSAQAGISLGYLSEVERGLKEPSSEVLDSILGSLGISMRDLLVEVLEVC
jgi:transcriptional regulator with XRE-family HTH domain